MYNPETVERVERVDPGLVYVDTLRAEPISVDVVRLEGELAVLKSWPRKFSSLGKTETNAIRKLQGIAGIPKFYYTYTPGNNNLFMAALREYVDGEDFFEKERTNEEVDKFQQLKSSVRGSGLKFPLDYKENNVLLVHGQPYLIDFELCTRTYIGSLYNTFLKLKSQ